MRGLTLDEQLDAFDRHAPAGLQDFIDYLEGNRAAIIAGARVRFKMGFQQYGSKTWRKSIAEIVQEAAEEGCDGTAYYAIIREKRERGE